MTRGCLAGNPISAAAFAKAVAKSGARRHACRPAMDSARAAGHWGPFCQHTAAATSKQPYQR
eukprot:352712-Chlamydomonas_euryale.AAC.11